MAKLKGVAGALVFFLAFAALGLADFNASSLPKPTGYVNDFAHVIPADQKAQLEALCTRIDQELGVQAAFVTMDTIDDNPIRDVGLDIFRKWGVGDKNTNQGVLVLLAIKDHKSDIEVGRGLEPYITDGFSGGTLRAMRPDLRAGDYGAALLQGAHAIAQQVAQGKNLSFTDNVPPPQRETPVRRTRGGIPGWMIIVAIFFLFWLLGRGRGGRGGYGGGRGGFLPGFFLGSMLGGGGRGWGRGDGWGDGGGFGGGDGGGGFGGFGGGDAGGGGASSDW